MATKIKSAHLVTEQPSTNAYTFEVRMVLQVLAPDEATARKQLDEVGGYVTRRDVELKDSVTLFDGKED